MLECLFRAILSNLLPSGTGSPCPFGTFYGHLVHFYPFWYVEPRKIWQPCNCEASQLFRSTATDCLPLGPNLSDRDQRQDESRPRLSGISGHMLIKTVT
jgi:hypothetical protein